MAQGKIVSVSREKGFGFIKPDKGQDVFFHYSSYEGEFDGLQVGDEVEFEPDPAAPKPRAKTITVIGPRAGNSSAKAIGKAKRRDAFYDAQLGFVIRLDRKRKLGFISPDGGGPELLFGEENVSGIREFHELSVGDSVRFLRDEAQADADPPLASAVQFTKRKQATNDLGLPNNPRARRKKPTWRK